MRKRGEGLDVYEKTKRGIRFMMRGELCTLNSIMVTASSRQAKTFTDAPRSNLQDKWGHQCEITTGIDPSHQGERRFEAMAAERFKERAR
jgi:hypothetical protein